MTTGINYASAAKEIITPQPEVRIELSHIKPKPTSNVPVINSLCIYAEISPRDKMGLRSPQNYDVKQFKLI